MSDDAIRLNSIKVNTSGKAQELKTIDGESQKADYGCWYNIAEDQKKDGATKSTESLMKEIQDYNKELNENHTNSLYTNQEILIPVQYAIIEVENNVAYMLEDVEASTKDYSAATQSVKDANEALEKAKKDKEDAQDALAQAIRVGANETQELEKDAQEKEDAYNEALQKHQDALDVQKAQLNDLIEAKDIMNI